MFHLSYNMQCQAVRYDNQLLVVCALLASRAARDESCCVIDCEITIIQCLTSFVDFYILIVIYGFKLKLA